MRDHPHDGLDVAKARRRLADAAAEAKRLEEKGSGHDAQAAWERYQVISDAIEAHERRARLTAR